MQSLNPSIAIVGASARAAAYSAHRAGFAPVAADLFADADLRRLCPATPIDRYPDDLLPWLREARPTAWMYTGALENYPELVDAMAQVAPLWGNDGLALRRVRSPWQLADTLRGADLLFPETRPSPDGLPRDGSWLAKTCRSAGGMGVGELGTPLPDGEQQGEGSEATDAIAGPPRGPGELVYQQRIPGTPCCAVYVANNKAVSLLGITRQLTGEPWLGARQFQYCGSIGWQTAEEAVMATIEHIGRVLAERFALVGLFGVDLIIDPDRRVWTIEVNPRYTASVEIVERATGIATLVLHAAACHDTDLETASMSRIAATSHGKVILFAKRDLSISEEFSEWALNQAASVPWPLLADVPRAGTVIECGRPILTLFAAGPSSKEVEQQLQRRAADLENRLSTTTGARR